MIPFLDLTLPEPLQERVASAMLRVMASNNYILGPETEKFETALAEHEGVKYAVTVGSGLDALTFLLIAHGIGPGDEVIVPAHTFIATWLAVTHCGATIVPVDVDPITHLLTPAAASAAITPRTKTIIPVHLYGHPCDVTDLGYLAERWGLTLIADAAQSLGATFHGNRLSSWCDSATSFYPGKNLGAMGDGGAVLTNDPAIAEKIRLLRNYGSPTKHQHVRYGYNSRLGELQAAVLNEKLPHLDDWNRHREAVAFRYAIELEQNPPIPGSTHHLYPISVKKGDRLRDRLTKAGIETGIHYPTPPHKQPVYSRYAKHSFPVTERIAANTLSLPMGPNLTFDQARHVAEIVNSG